MKKGLSIFLFVLLVAINSPAPAGVCTNTDDGFSISGAGISLCVGDLDRMIYRVHELGLCSSFPDMTSGPSALSSCEVLTASPFDVDLTIGKRIGFDGVRPRNGSYQHFYRIIGADTQFVGLMKFADGVTYTGGTLDGEAGTTSGRYCQAPTAEFSADHFFQTNPSDASVCSASEPDTRHLSTVKADNLFSNSFAPIMSNIFDIGVTLSANSEADQNFFLLDAEYNVATERSEVEYIMMTTPADENGELTISNQTDGLDIGFSLTDSLNAYVICAGGSCTVEQVMINARTLSINEK